MFKCQKTPFPGTTSFYKLYRRCIIACCVIIREKYKMAKKCRLHPFGTAQLIWCYRNSIIILLLLIACILMDLSVHFSGHFPVGSGLAGNRMSPFWILLLLRMMEVVVTTGAIRCSKLQSNHHHQQINTKLFTGRMPFLPDNLAIFRALKKLLLLMDSDIIM